MAPWLQFGRPEEEAYGHQEQAGAWQKILKPLKSSVREKQNNISMFKLENYAEINFLIPYSNDIRCYRCYSMRKSKPILGFV